MKKRIAYVRAVQALQQGGVVAIPTETVYGLACDPRNTRAVQRVFALKGRDPNKPLLLVAGSLAQVQQVAVLDALAKRIAKRYWPGALTLILPIKQPTELVSGVAVHGGVAIRYSSSPIVQTLARRFGYPLVATSANKSGEPVCQSVRAIRRALPEIAEVIDVGFLSPRAPSTVIRIKKDGSIEYVRRGAIKNIRLEP